MADNPVTVTVVIPCYNHAAYVEKAVHSVLNQTYPHVELLTYDDGSSDGSADIIQRLADEHGFFFQRQENQGLTRTLNNALSKASGKYFSMLSSDDYIMADKLERLVAFMEQRPDVGLCGGGHIVIDNDGVCDLKQRLRPHAELDFDDVFTMQKHCPTAVSMMARLEALQKVEGYDEAIRLEDVDMWLKITHAGYKIANLQDVFGYYRKHETNTYKQIDFMLQSLLASYSKYSDHPEYATMVQRIKISALLKAAKRNKPLAKKILQELPLSAYNMRVIRAWGRLYLG